MVTLIFYLISIILNAFRNNREKQALMHEKPVIVSILDHYYSRTLNSMKFHLLYLYLKCIWHFLMKCKFFRNRHGKIPVCIDIDLYPSLLYCNENKNIQKINLISNNFIFSKKFLSEKFIPLLLTNLQSHFNNLFLKT